MRPLLLLPVFCFAACVHSELTASERELLHLPVDQFGERIYSGSVTPNGSPAPVFRYERRVLEAADGTRVSTHVTFEGTEPLVLQRAKQDAQGRLLWFDEVHAQHGDTQHLDGGNFVVGPTLFEFVRAHLPELRAGREVTFDFWARGETYGFALRLVGDSVEMRATNFLISMALAPIRLRLGEGDQVIQYRGRIPPLLDGHEVDAEVTYDYFLPFR